MTEPQEPRPNYPSYPGPESAPSGMTPYPTGYGQPPETPSKGPAGPLPGSVLSSAIITIVLSIGTLLTALGTLLSIDDAIKYVHDHPDDLSLKASDIPSDSDLRSTLVAAGVILIIVAAIGILLAVLNLMRQNWARIALIVTSILTAIVAIIPSLALIGLPWLAGGIAVIVLLLTSKAKAWFAAPRTV